MSTMPRFSATSADTGREHAFTPHVARVAHGSPCVSCISPSDDRSALLVDIYEADDALILKATAPGALDEDIDVVTAGNVLTIHVTQRPGVRPEGSSAIRRERYAGPCRRVIELQFTVEESALSSTLERGVLTVRIAKPQAAK
ncbi:MAG TPA: Hsp20/alpha crystallin family protein [Ktedonobacterales bacterium]